MTPQRLKQPIPMAKSLIFQMQCLNSLKEKFAGLSGAASLPESGNITSKASTADSASSHAGVFDPMVVITAEQTSACPHFFEEKESFGFNVADVIAQRVNDAYKAAGAKVERIARYIQERTKL